MKEILRRFQSQATGGNQIVIVGANDIGVQLAQSLGEKNLNIILIDEKEENLRGIQEEADVLTISGHPLALETLKDLGIDKRTTLLAVSNSDKLNLLLLYLGESLGIGHGYALIGDQDYYESFLPIFAKKEKLHLINLWELVLRKIEARSQLEICHLLRNEKENLLVMAVQFFKGHPFINTNIDRLRSKRGGKPLQVIRGNQFLHPNKRMSIESDDILLFRIEESEQDMTLKKWNSLAYQKKVILGGHQLLPVTQRHWPQFSKKLVTIEEDYAKGQQLLNILTDGLILKGDGLDISLMDEAGLKEAQLFIAATEHDEANLLSSLLAQSFGVPHVIPILQRRQHSDLLDPLKLKGIISIPQLVVNSMQSRLLPEKKTTLDHISLHCTNNGEIPNTGFSLVNRWGQLIPFEKISLKKGDEVLNVKLNKI